MFVAPTANWSTVARARARACAFKALAKGEEQCRPLIEPSSQSLATSPQLEASVAIQCTQYSTLLQNQNILSNEQSEVLPPLTRREVLYWRECSAGGPWLLGAVT
eukprot:scaffold263057_cov32-Tisochrysis_lutea.AAC.7